MTMMRETLRSNDFFSSLSSPFYFHSLLSPTQPSNPIATRETEASADGLEGGGMAATRRRPFRSNANKIADAFDSAFARGGCSTTWKRWWFTGGTPKPAARRRRLDAMGKKNEQEETRKRPETCFCSTMIQQVERKRAREKKI